MSNRIRFAYPGVLALLLGSLACNAAGLGLGPTETPTSTPTPTVTPSPTPTATLTPTATYTPSPTPVPGIEAPLMVNGLEITFTEVSFQETYDMGGQSFHATASDDILMLVTATINTDDIDALEDWEIFITDENERDSHPGITSRRIVDGNLQMTWISAVDEASEHFTFTLPDGQELVLDPLIEDS